jgi:hypothetical protein
VTFAAEPNSKPRVLFYLPVVTRWWFTNIIVPLIRAASRGGEVHVLVPPLWSCTGIGVEELAGCTDLVDVNWHILDRGDHPDLRFSALDKPYLLELVQEIDPDLCLCRSADIETPTLFPGMVRYIMEGAAPPFALNYHTVYLANTLFDHGLMPELTPEQAAWLDAAFAAPWSERKASLPFMEREEFLARAGLPAGKLLIGLPLEYEHQELFFDQHNIFANNIELIDALASAIDDDIVLAVTKHPLNEGSGGDGGLQGAIARHNGKVVQVQPIGERGEATALLTRHSDGMIVCNSKSFANCAFLGRPTLRISKFASGEWLRFYASLAPFIETIRLGTARGADESDARRWFAFHLANTVLEPCSPELDLEGLFDHAVNPFNPARWERGLARYLGDDADLLPPLTVSHAQEGLCRV